MCLNKMKISQSPSVTCSWPAPKEIDLHRQTQSNDYLNQVLINHDRNLRAFSLTRDWWKQEIKF